MLNSLCFIYSIRFETEDWTTTAPNATFRLVDGTTVYDSTDRGRHYHAQMRGFFVPPKDGQYRMAINVDDVGKLNFSESGDPSNLVSVKLNYIF